MDREGLEVWGARWRDDPREVTGPWGSDPSPLSRLGPAGSRPARGRVC